MNYRSCPLGFVLACFFSCTLWAQKPYRYTVRVEIPYGMTVVDSTLYVDDTEITVGEWLEFYYYSLDSSRAIPNPVCRPQFPEGQKPAYAFLFETDARTALYLNYKSYNNGEASRPVPVPADSVHSRKEFNRLRKRYMYLPIACVSYEQATAYCAWRTRRYNQGRRSYGLEFRLPSPAELELWNDDLDSVVVNKSGRWPTGNYRDSPGVTRFAKAAAWRR